MGFMDKIKQFTGTDEYDDADYSDDSYYGDITEPYDTDSTPVTQQTAGNQTGSASNQYGTPYSGNGSGYSSYSQPQQPASSTLGGLNIGGAALQMKVIRPETFASVSQIADHLLSQRTVVLNLEATNKETARRLIDFLSGVAYSIDGSLKRIANNAYIITPSNVDVSGESLREQRKGNQQQQSDDDGGNEPYEY